MTSDLYMWSSFGLIQGIICMTGIIPPEALQAVICMSVILLGLFKPFYVYVRSPLEDGYSSHYLYVRRPFWAIKAIICMSVVRLGCRWLT